MSDYAKSLYEIDRKQDERNKILQEVLQILTQIFPSQQQNKKSPATTATAGRVGGDEGYGVNIAQKQIASPTVRVKKQVDEIRQGGSKGDAAISQIFKRAALLFTPEATKFHQRLQSEIRALAQNPQKQVDLDWLSQAQQTLRNNVELLRELVALQEAYFKEMFQTPRGKADIAERNYWQQEAGEQLKLGDEMRMQMALSDEILKKLKELRDRQELQRKQRLQSYKKSGGGRDDMAPEWHTGPRGGKFYMDQRSGRKVYAKRRRY